MWIDEQLTKKSQPGEQLQIHKDHGEEKEHEKLRQYISWRNSPLQSNRLQSE